MDADYENLVDHGEIGGGKLDKHSTDIDAMVLDAPDPEEVGKEDGIEAYEKVWGDLSSQLSIYMTQIFRVGYLLESLILIQDRAVELLQNLCAGLATDRT